MRPNLNNNLFKRSFPNLFLLLFFVVAPLLFITRFVSRFNYDSEIVFLHSALLLVTLASCVLVGFFVTSIFKKKVKLISFFLALIITVGWGLLYLIYTSAYISNLVFQDNANYEILSNYLKFSPNIFGPPLFVTSYHLIYFFVYLLALGLLLLLVFKTLNNSLRKLYSLPARKLRSSFLCCNLTVLLLGTGILMYCFKKEPWKFNGEPVTNFFKWPRTSDLIGMDADRVNAAIRDIRVREEYPELKSNSLKKNVVLIIADSLRADHLPFYGYKRNTAPFLNSLYKQGKLFKVDTALSLCSESYCGISTILASRSYHSISPKVFKLNELLKKQAYEVNYILAGDHRAWRYLNDFYGDQIDRFIDFKVLDKYSTTDDRVVLEGLQSLPEFSDTPSFIYFFLMSPHVFGERWSESLKYKPYEFTDIKKLWGTSFKFTGSNGQKIAYHDTDPVGYKTLVNRYDNGVVQFDTVAKRIFEILGSKGYLNNSLVIITGDHGDSLGEHGTFGHGRYLHQEEIRVPLLIFDTDGFKYKNKDFATHLDIAPTILDRLKLPIPDTWEGIPLTLKSERRITFHQTRRGTNICRAVVSKTSGGLYKYLRCGDFKKKMTEELYNIGEDPIEADNLIKSANSDILSNLRDAFENFAIISTNACSSIECID